MFPPFEMPLAPKSSMKCFKVQGVVPNHTRPRHFQQPYGQFRTLPKGRVIFEASTSWKLQIASIVIADLRMG